MQTNFERVSPKQAYEWVKTGHWSLKQFSEWFAYHAPNAYNTKHE